MFRRILGQLSQNFSQQIKTPEEGEEYSTGEYYDLGDTPKPDHTEEPLSFTNLFISTLADVYAADSYDVVSGKFNYKTINEYPRPDDIQPYLTENEYYAARIKKYRHNPIVLLTSFFWLAK